MKTTSQKQLSFVGTVLFLVFVNQQLFKAQAPVVSFSFSQAGGGTVNFQSTSTNVPANSTYLWRFGDGSSTSTLSTTNTSHTYTASGTYYAFLALYRPDNVLYDSTAKPVIITNVYAGLKNNAIASHLELYPNPARDVINLDLEGVSGKASISVYDIMGREISKEQIQSGQKLQLNTSKYLAGPYVVQVSGENLLLTRKIVITRD